MSREIKFRGLRTDGKGWVYGGVVYGKSGNVYIFQGNDIEIVEDDCLEVVHETVGQFIGLKDKNGKEIYSNDDVRWFGASGVEDAIGFVKWDNDKSAYVVYVDDYNEHYLYDVHYADLEVIGNIHENE